MCILRSIYLHLSLHGQHQILRFWIIIFSSSSFELEFSWFGVNHDESLEQSPVNWLHVSRVCGYVENVAHILFHTWLWNSCSSSSSGLKFFKRSSNFLMYFYPSVLDDDDDDFFKKTKFLWQAVARSLILKLLPLVWSLMILTSFCPLFQNQVDTDFHAWSHFQLETLVEVLRDCPRRYSYR